METKNIKIKQITSVVHKTKGRLKTPAYVTNKKKENLLIHLGSISKKNTHEHEGVYAAHLKYDFAPTPELHHLH